MNRQQGILLEAGTNEFEVLEFLVGEQRFGINALKVREVVQFAQEKITVFPHSAPGIMGTMLFHGSSRPVIDLRTYLEIGGAAKAGSRKLVLMCEFNSLVIGFLIDGVDSIYRVSWKDIQVPNSIGGLGNAMITGIALISGHETVMLDFEAIASDLLNAGVIKEDELEADQAARAQVPQVDEALRQRRSRLRIFAADDASIIRRRLGAALADAGFTQVTWFHNGKDAYDRMVSLKDAIADHVDVMVTDIEMPQMDGLTLCKNIKAFFPGVKVLIFSSMMTEQMVGRCQSVRADAFFNKDQIVRLIAELDRLFSS